MAYRLKLDGSLECDFAQEALALLDLIHKKKAVEEAIPGGQSGAAVPLPPKPKYRHNANVHAFISALQDSFPEPRSTNDIATQLQITAKGIPAVVLGVRSLLSKFAINFDEAVEYRKRLDGTVIVRQYRLTSLGYQQIRERITGEGATA